MQIFYDLRSVVLKCDVRSTTDTPYPTLLFEQTQTKPVTDLRPTLLHFRKAQLLVIISLNHVLCLLPT